MKQKERIIVVDDSLDNLNFIRNILMPFYEVYTVNSCDALFNLLAILKPELILLDIEMPNVNGYQTLENLSKINEYKDISAVFLTAKNEDGDEEIGFNLGAKDYIKKPFKSTNLLKKIELVLSVNRLQNELRITNENHTKKIAELNAKILSLELEIKKLIKEKNNS